jgi:thiamine biosynthesis protein ThiS
MHIQQHLRDQDDIMIMVDNQSVDWRPGMTVDEAIASLADGHIYAVVRLNGKLVSRPNFSTTLVEDGAVIIPIPMIAGG